MKNPELKPPHKIAQARSIKPCQRPGCLNLGQMRRQRREHITRSIHLCDWCLASLLPIELNELFVNFGVNLIADRGDRQEGDGGTGQT
jgi:hypothetical protein